MTYEKAKRSVSYSSLYKLVKLSWNYRYMLSIGMLCSLASGVEALLPKLISDFIELGLNQRNMTVLMYAPLCVVVFFMLKGIFNYYASYCLGYVARQVVKVLRVEILKKTISIDQVYFTVNPSNNVISKINYDCEQVSGIISRALYDCMRGYATAIGIVVTLILINAKLTAFTLVIMPVLAVLISICSKHIRRYSGKIQDSIAEITNKSREIISGLNDIKICSASEKQKEESSKLIQNNFNQEMKLIKIDSFASPLLQVIGSFGIMIFMYLACFDPSHIGTKLTIAEFTAYSFAIVYLLKPLKQLTMVYSTINRGVVAAKNIFDFTEQPDEVDLGNIKDVAEINIDIKGLNYFYDDKKVLDNINLSIKKDTITAIIGRSGSGKTTLIKLLSKIIRPLDGELLINGHCINSYINAGYRKNIAVVSQDIFLLDGTIKDNILLGLDHYEPSDLEQVIKQSGIDLLLDKFPKGMDTNIGENGLVLSGGGRQRLALARALIRKPKLLILDEPTSALDHVTESIVFDSLNNLAFPCTRILVTHNLSLAKDLDQIIIIENGKIVAAGKHDYLLESSEYYLAYNKIYNVAKPAV